MSEYAVGAPNVFQDPADLFQLTNKVRAPHCVYYTHRRISVKAIGQPSSSPYPHHLHRQPCRGEVGLFAPPHVAAYLVRELPFAAPIGPHRDERVTPPLAVSPTSRALQL